MLEKILQYQNTEMELINLESELAKSKDRERAAEIQQLLKNQHARLVSLEEAAMKVNGAYTKATEKYEDYSKKLDNLENEMKNVDASKMALYEKTYKDFAAIGASLERDIQNIYTQVQQISKEYEDIIKKSKTDRERFDKFKAAYTALKNDKEPKIAAVKAELSKLEKELESKTLSTYRQKREGNLFPVFVALSSNKCGGCRMEISASKLGQMKSNELGIIECENCGRLIYQK